MPVLSRTQQRNEVSVAGCKRNIFSLLQILNILVAKWTIGHVSVFCLK